VATDTRTIKRHAVQTSSDFSTWTTQTAIRCNECSEGAGQVVGAASLIRFIGTVREPGATGSPASQTPLTGLVGKWIRVLIEEVGGSVTISSVDYNPLWYGIIDAERIIDTGGGTGQQSWVCSGLAAHLARVGAMEAWCDAVDYTGAYSARPSLRVPTFNDKDSQGIRSGARTGTVDGATVQIFDGFGATAWNAATAWTAKEALEAILAANGRFRTPGGTTFTGGVSFALSAGTLLNWTLPTLDINGMSVLDAVNSIISPRRGLSWRMTVSGAVATIEVRSISAADITVGSTTLAAATDTATPDLSGLWIGGVELIEDQSATYDHIRVVGNRPWVVCSMSYDQAGPPAEVGALQPAWTTTQQTAWGTAPDSTTDGVYRSFRIGLKWAGNVSEAAGASGLRQALTVTSGDYTGARTFSATAFGPVSLVAFDSRLPCGEGWTTDKAGPRQEPLLVWMPAGGTAWYDLQGGPPSPWSMALQIDDFPASLHIGRPTRDAVNKGGSDQSTTNKVIGTTGKILATVGVREPDPLVVSWTRASGSWPRTNPRTLTVQMPTAEQWVILNNTVKGISGTSLVKQSGESTIRDDVPLMQSWLAFLRAYYGEPSRSLTWTNAGAIEHAYGSGASAPAALVTTATLGTGSTTVNAVVTRRTWRLDEDGYGTSYNTDRIVPDIEAIR
jgi:hypothetical protein